MRKCSSDGTVCADYYSIAEERDIDMSVFVIIGCGWSLVLVEMFRRKGISTREYAATCMLGMIKNVLKWISW